MSSELLLFLSRTVWGASSAWGSPSAGLRLVPGPAMRSPGRAAAGLVDQLTTGVIATGPVHETLAAIEEFGAARFRLIVGAPGSGKSTLQEVLIGPKSSAPSASPTTTARDSRR